MAIIIAANSITAKIIAASSIATNSIAAKIIARGTGRLNKMGTLNEAIVTEDSRRQWLSRYGEGVAALVCGLLIVLAWSLGEAAPTGAVVLYVLAFVIGGFASAREGLQTLIHERDFDVNFLMIIAAIGAAMIGYWTEGAILIFIFSLSGALETYTMNRSHRDISALMDLKPETAIRYKDGQEMELRIEALNIGDVVIVKPGMRIPTDGEIVEGVSAVDQATITGESIPVDKGSGDEVYAGTVNGQGALFVKVTQTSEATLFAKIIKMVQEAQSEKPASQLFIERFERIYARIIIVAAIGLIVIPPWLLQWTWEEALYKAMVFLVVASPCALVASIMPAVLSGISSSARKGLLFKGGLHLEKLAHVRLVAFDKTGTLTRGKPEVTDIIALDGTEEDERDILHIAASLESLSEHPLATAIVSKARQLDIEIERPSELHNHVGMGIEAKWRGETWKIGKPAFAGEQSGEQSEAQQNENQQQNETQHREQREQRKQQEQLADLVDRLEQDGKTVTVLHNTQRVVGVIALRDTVREEAKLAVSTLKRLGIEVAMLTGDQKRTAEAIGREIGIEHVYADLLPEQKVERMKHLREQYGDVVMVGDGVNDAPALATATVGIAMGGAGSDTALETADLVLMNDDTTRIPSAIQLGKRASRIIKQNVTFSIAVIALLIIFNFTLGISLPLGVIGHEGSTILVILNGLRLLR